MDRAAKDRSGLRGQGRLLGGSAVVEGLEGRAEFYLQKGCDL